MATAHLIHGFLGVGKTTFAKQLERNLPAIRFTHDEWMVRFYGSNPPAHLFPAFARKVSEQIGLLWPRCLELGMDVVLDLGFWTRHERDEARATAEDMGADVLLYRVACPEQVARERLEARNQSLDGLLVCASLVSRSSNRAMYSNSVWTRISSTMTIANPPKTRPKIAVTAVSPA